MTVDLVTFLLIEALIGAGIIIWRQMKKSEALEQRVVDSEAYIEALSSTIDSMDEQLKEIDQRGSFQADDEIGWFFEQVKVMQKSLNQFRLTNGRK